MREAICEWHVTFTTCARLHVNALAGNGLSLVVSIAFYFLRSDLVVAPWNLSFAAWNTEPETTVGCARP